MDTEGRFQDETEKNARQVWKGDHEEDCSREAQRRIGEKKGRIRAEHEDDCTTQKEEVTQWRREDEEQFAYPHQDPPQQPGDGPAADGAERAKGG
jgi:hypothetical protein